MNNEPVAWMDEINTFVLDTDYKQFPKSLQNGMIPLYTHPVKELTDEEITEMAKRKANQILMDLLMPDVGNERRIDWNVGCTREHLKNFAKAILRKAQEK